MNTVSQGVFSPAALDHELSQLHTTMPNARLVGSLGRSIIYGRIYGDPEYEFNLRCQDPIGSVATPRDIDVAGIPANTGQAYRPFEIDTTGFAGPFLNIQAEGDTWFLIADRHGFAEELHPAVMEPQSGTAVLGISAVTVPAQTLVELYGLKESLRPKDIATRGMLTAAIADSDRRDDFDEDFLNPFVRLRQLNTTDAYIRAQNIYRKYVPGSVRKHAVPHVQKLKKVLF
ncbi:MAG: hypothetical protein JWM81_656 [Candidatus Saccharibacteria bacterium]|nr:hypothetical protein [Candidatus Saccharibacteria bacterium]